MPTLDEPLTTYIDWLRQHRGDEIDFVVLYGSRARGQHRPHSDYDLLIGLRYPSLQRFRDRLEDFDSGSRWHMEVKAFTPDELQRLWFHYSRTLLDALYEGVVLIDNGGWQWYRQRYEAKVARGVLERRGRMWVWHHDLEPPDSPRRAERLRLQEEWRQREGTFP